MAGNRFRVGPEDDPDRYRVDRLHSSGAEGQLWRGTRIITGGVESDVELDVAIKILQPHQGDLLNHWRERWERHVELLRSLQYPGVVTVREAFEGPPMHLPSAPAPPGRNLYLIMNWEDGEPLNEWVSNRPQPHNVFDDFRILTQVADALDYLHSGRATKGVPILHRDIKPSNVIVTEHGAVLVDFGLMQTLTTNPTAAGLGTPGYLAPETARGEYSPASDRYSLGCVAYYVLTGHDPPEGGAAAMRPALSRIPGVGSEALVDHLLAMVDTDPQARPHPAAAWAQPFRASTLSRIAADAAASRAETVRDSLGPGASREAPTRYEEHRPVRQRRNDRPLVAGALLVSVLLIGAIVLFGQRGGDEQVAQHPGPSGSTTVTPLTQPSTTFPTTSTVVVRPPPIVSTTAPPRDGIYRSQGLAVSLKDYEIRADSNPETGAVKYVVTFANTGQSTVAVKFAYGSVSASDNVGTSYADITSRSAAWWDATGRARCGCVSGCLTFTYRLEEAFDLPPGETKSIESALVKSDMTNGDCQTGFVNKTRAPFSATYVDLRIASVAFRTGQLSELTNLLWRLPR